MTLEEALKRIETLEACAKFDDLKWQHLWSIHQKCRDSFQFLNEELGRLRTPKESNG